MFIQTEATPNPATLKFLPGRPVLPDGVLDIPDAAQAAKSPLAERLFAVPGVTGVFLGSDFITVTKTDSEWQQIKPAILGAIMEHFMSGAPMMATGAGAAAAEDEFFETKDADTVATIKELIETRVRPAVANDGGDITFRGFKDGIVARPGHVHRHPGSSRPRYLETLGAIRGRHTVHSRGEQVPLGLPCEGKQAILRVLVGLDGPVTQDMGDGDPTFDQTAADK